MPARTEDLPDEAPSLLLTGVRPVVLAQPRPLAAALAVEAEAEPASGSGEEPGIADAAELADDDADLDAEEWLAEEEVEERAEGGFVDGAAAYLREIGTVPLLSPEEERALAEAIACGEAARDRLSGPLLFSTDERQRLAHAVRRGEDSKRRLVEANLRLVVQVAKRYRVAGLSLLDLVQEGNIGLMKAAEKYDHTLGFRFSTYAVWWIRQSIMRALSEKGHAIRLPSHAAGRLNTIKKAQHRLYQTLEREPTVDELAWEVGLPSARVRSTLTIEQTATSLDEPVGDEEGSVLADFVPDESQASPEELATRPAMRRGVEALVATLSPREQTVVRWRFGFDGERTLEEIGEALGVTRERVRQIERHALRKLRANTRTVDLRAFLN